MPQKYSSVDIEYALSRATLFCTGCVGAIAVVSRFVDRRVVIFLFPLLLVAFAICDGLTNFRGRSNQLVGAIASVISFGLLVASMMKLDYSNPGLMAWRGFGVLASLFSLLALGLLVASANRIPRCIVGWAALVVSVMALLLYIPLFIQPPYGILNLGDTTYHVFDELLAPSVGKIAYFNYSFQYGGILGWIFTPISWAPISASIKMTIILLLCNLLILMIPVMCTLSVNRFFPTASRKVLFVSIIAVWCVSGSLNGHTSALAEFANISRYFPLSLTVLTFARMLTCESADETRTWTTICGVLSGLSILNSPEFGVLMALSFVVPSLLLSMRGHREDRFYRRFIPTVFLTIGLYFCLFSFFFGLPKRDAIVGIRLSYMSSQVVDSSFFLPLLGPHLFWMAVGVASVVQGCSRLTSRMKDHRDFGLGKFQVSVGVLSLGLLVKFLSRPIPQAIPHYLIPIILASIPLVLTLLGELKGTSNYTFSRILRGLPTLLLAVLPIGAAANAPNPIDEYRRVLSPNLSETDWSVRTGRPIDQWSVDGLNRAYDNLFAEVNEISTEYSRGDKGTVGYFGIHGNTVELVTGVQNVFGIQAPESLVFGGAQTSLACLPLYDAQPHAVILYGTSFPCHGYTEIFGAIEAPFRILLRNKPD